MKLRTLLIIYLAFSFSALYGCDGYGQSASGTGIEAVNNGPGDIVIISSKAGEDVEGSTITGDTITPAPEVGVEDEDGLIFGCSIESEAEGVCSRSPD